MATATKDFSDGVADAGSPDTEKGNRQSTPQEKADCKVWMGDSGKILTARAFDKVARKRYAQDRRYARADAGNFLVDVPIAQSYIDVLRSFLYAQDPNVDVTASGFSTPPPQKEIESMVLASQADAAQAAQTATVPGGEHGGIASIIAARQQMHGANAPGMVPGLPGPPGAPPPPSFGASPPGAPPGGAPPSNGPPSQTGTDPQSILLQQVTAILKPYQQLRDDSKQLADTLELVIASLWKKGKLKRQALPLVNSGLTIGIGWIKACWLQRTGKDPVIQQQIDDVLENLATMGQTKRKLESGDSACDEDALKAELQKSMEGLEAKVERVIARGFAIDFIAGEDMQVAPEARDMGSYLDAPWIAQRAFIPLSQAQADMPDIEKRLPKATLYYRQKVTDATASRDSGVMASDEIRSEEADTYTKGGTSSDASSNTTISTGDGEPCICFWEVWDRDTSMVCSYIEGLDCYGKAPYPPDPGTSRFYPYFNFIIGAIDGERHPRSLVTRSERLFDEYNRTRSNFSIHRSRTLPKTAFLKNMLDAKNADALANGAIQEMVGIDSLNPNLNLANIIAPIVYARIDEALYDTAVIRAELEQIWGVQEALSSSIHTPKTATEAQIQQEGSKSRTGYMRAGLDEMMNDLAQYTAEVSLQKMSVEDVKAIAGPWCLWPQDMGIEDLNALVNVSIHAGSTGKPDTAAQQQAWAAIMPQMKEAIQEIGALRGSTKEEVADCYEALVAETLRRTGDRIDPTAFLPDPPRTPPPPPPPPAPPPIELTAFAGTQMAALTAMLADVKSGVITPASAIALMQMVAPAVPIHLVQQAVQGAQPMPGDPAVAMDTKHVSPVVPAVPSSIHIHPVAPGGRLAEANAPAAPAMPAGPLPNGQQAPLPRMSPMPMNPGDLAK